MCYSLGFKQIIVGVYLYPNLIFNGSLILNVPGIFHALWFNKHDLAFVLGDRPVFSPFGYYIMFNSSNARPGVL